MVDRRELKTASRWWMMVGWSRQGLVRTLFYAGMGEAPRNGWRLNMHIAETEDESFPSSDVIGYCSAAVWRRLPTPAFLPPMGRQRRFFHQLIRIC